MYILYIYNHVIIYVNIYNIYILRDGIIEDII